MPKHVFYLIPKDRQLKLLKPALVEFTRKPYDKINVTSLTSIMDILRTDFYYYFLDKDDLYDELLNRLNSFILKAGNASTFDDIRIILFNVISSNKSSRLKTYMIDLTDNYHPAFIDHFVDVIKNKNIMNESNYELKVKVLEFITLVNFFLKEKMTKDEVIERLKKNGILK